MLFNIANALDVPIGEIAGYNYDTNHDKKYDFAWDDWLNSNNVYFIATTVNGAEGMLMQLSHDGDIYFLEDKQANKLPAMCAENLRTLIKARCKRLTEKQSEAAIERGKDFIKSLNRSTPAPSDNFTNNPDHNGEELPFN